MTGAELEPQQAPSWDKLPREPRKAFHAFGLYRDMLQERKLSRVAGLLGHKDLGTVKDWSRRWRWVERSAEYDLYLDRRQREEMERDLGEMNRAHRAAAASMLTTALVRLNGDEARDIEALDPRTISPDSIPRYIDVAVKVDRIARGQPTDLLKSSTMVPGTVVERIGNDLVDIAMRYIPEDHQALFISDVQAYAQRGAT